MSTCPRCGNEKHRGRCKGGGKGVTRKGSNGPPTGAKPEPPPNPPPADAGLQTGPALSIAPGLGLSAWIENGCLQLAQGDDVVALSQTEAKVLFAQFDEWVRA